MATSSGDRGRGRPVLDSLTTRLPGAVLWLALAAFACFLLAIAIAYVSSPAMPFGYYKDLGVNIYATANIDASIHGFSDLIDSIGWAPWDNGPAFAFNPMASYAFLVPLAKLVHHDAVAAVKCAQVVQFLIAWAGGACLYAVLVRRASPWALVAGLAYAVLPNTAIQIRGNVDFGFVAALTPAALALSIAAVDRIGVWALPIAGVLCGLSALGFAIEFLFFSSVPMYAVCALRAFRRRNVGPWAAFASVGAILTVSAGAFVILPSLASAATFREPASQIGDIASGELTSLFSETFPLLATLVPKEGAISPTPAFNVTSSLGMIAPATAALWFGALCLIAVPSNVRRLRLGSALAVLAVCTVLALGTNVLFGQLLWATIARVPVLQLLRTPDRFIELPALFVPLFAVAACEVLDDWLAARSAAAGRIVATAVVCLALVALVAFDGREHVLALEPTVAIREPATVPVNEEVAQIGGRTIPLAFVAGGSSFDAPLYGAGTPFERYGWDLIERFGADGIGAGGLLSRAGVRSIVASPNWTDAPTLPNLAAVFGASGGMRRVLEDRGVSVFVLDRTAPDVTAVVPACFSGSVGSLDRLLAVPALRGVAVEPGPDVRCEASVVAGSADRRPGSRGRDAWPASTISDPASALHDADYGFIVGRNLLSPAWYRDAVDGTEPSFERPAVLAGAGWSATLPSIDRSIRSADLFVRLANHAAIRGAVDVAGRTVAFAFAPATGLRWHRIALGAIPRDAAVRVRLLAVGSDAFPRFAWHGVALDAFALREHGVPVAGFDASSIPTFAALGTGDFDQRGHSDVARVVLPPGAYRASAYAANNAAVALTGATFDGRLLANPLVLRAAAEHTLSVRTLPKNALLLFQPMGRAATLVQPAVVRRSAAAWDIDVSQAQTIEAAVLSDGNWELLPSAAPGFACDLINTCFAHVTPGRYRLHHLWPRSLVIGIAVTTLAVVIAFAVFYVGIRRIGPAL